MKNPGRRVNLIEMRDAELMKAFRRELALAGYIVVPHILAKLAQLPASRFWISEERAAAVVNAMLAGRKLPKMRDNKREMFEEIFRRFLALRSREPGRSVIDLVTTVVNQSAPRFYLAPRSIGEYIRRMNWYGRKQQNRH